MHLPDFELIKKYKIIIFLFLIYFAGVGIYFGLGGYTKNLFFVPDERLYIQAAKALANGSGIYYNGLPSTFQKIFYSLIFSPAYLVDNLHVQVKLICLLSTMFEMTSIFPIFLISRKLGIDRGKSILISLFSLTVPTFLNSMTFMSESAFLPLWLWAIYIIVLLLDSDEVKIGFSILLGILGYALYMCKEVGIVAMPALILVKLILILRKKANVKGFVSCGISAGVFAVLYLIVRFFVFSGEASTYSYAITAPQAPEESGKNPISFLLFAAFYYLGYMILVTNIFPLFVRNKEDNLNSRLSMYIEIALLTLILVVVYKISLKEDYGLLSPRLHLRYFEPLFIPYLICFIARFNSIKEDSIFKSKYLKLVFFVYLVILLVLPGLEQRGGILDATTSTVYLLPERIAISEFLGSPRMTVILNVVLKLIIIGIVLLELWLLKKKKRIFYVTFIVLVLVINVVGSSLKYKDLRASYELPTKYVNEMQDINDELGGLKGEKLIVVNELSRLAEIAITYYDMEDTDISLTDEEYKSTDEEVTLKAGNSFRMVCIYDYDYVVYDRSIWDEMEPSKLPNAQIEFTTENYYVVKIK